jgi:hypothetical protein
MDKPGNKFIKNPGKWVISITNFQMLKFGHSWQKNVVLQNELLFQKPPTKLKKLFTNQLKQHALKN